MPQPGVPLEFVAADGPVREPVTKVGGQPVWLEEPQWPVSRTTGEPMEFLGQFALDGGRLAYLFMTGEGDGWTWHPERGDNALVIQPSGRIPDFVTVRAQAEGPSAGEDHLPRTAERHSSLFLGGPDTEPEWVQDDEHPGEGWELVVQLTEELPFFVNFGDAGAGWAFVSPDGKEGRFLWQCC
ncbi:hypothetical protein [Nonomuraea sp. bgisy101]|uniref:hypothetical protein n=1 Tax=Nonomuraea sp. bgisy101 TaxID=3413784 RepID=UPI003D719CA6